MSIRICSCGTTLEEGFIADYAHHATLAAVWVEGPPGEKKSFWEASMTGSGIKLQGREARVLEAWRCPACGRLELYANNKPEAPSGGSGFE